MSSLSDIAQRLNRKQSDLKTKLDYIKKSDPFLNKNVALIQSQNSGLNQVLQNLQQDQRFNRKQVEQKNNSSSSRFQICESKFQNLESYKYSYQKPQASQKLIIDNPKNDFQKRFNSLFSTRNKINTYQSSNASNLDKWWESVNQDQQKSLNDSKTEKSFLCTQNIIVQFFNYLKIYLVYNAILKHLCFDFTATIIYVQYFNAIIGLGFHLMNLSSALKLVQNQKIQKMSIQEISLIFYFSRFIHLDLMQLDLINHDFIYFYLNYLYLTKSKQNTILNVLLKINYLKSKRNSLDVKEKLINQSNSKLEQLFSHNQIKILQKKLENSSNQEWDTFNQIYIENLFQLASSISRVVKTSEFYKK